MAGATLLTTIVPHDPIYCNFEVDERRVLEFTRMFFEGKSGGREGEQIKVDIAVSDKDEFEFHGVVDYTENQLDRETATLQIRAKVENENEFLTPGLFARFAWVLKEDNTVEERYVETGTLEGDLRIITGGVEKDELIAVSGVQLLRPQFPLAPATVPMVGE